MRTQALVTELVFDHALKIRIKAEVATSTPSSSAVTTPDTASLAESSNVSPVDPAGGSASGDETDYLRLRWKPRLGPSSAPGEPPGHPRRVWLMVVVRVQGPPVVGKVSTIGGRSETSR